MTGQISPHFTWSEAACHSGAEVPTELQDRARLLATRVLEIIRQRWGGPIAVISWYRTRWYNQAIQGAQHSRHMQADAADIRPTDMATLPAFRGLIEEMIKGGELPALGGFGVYPGWVHVDARPRPAQDPTHIARWFGKGVGSEVA